MNTLFKPVGGINWRSAPWDKEMSERQQCVYLQNIRFKDSYFETIPGYSKYHGRTLGTNPITAIMPYYNDQTGDFKLLTASGRGIYRRNPAANEFETLVTGLSENSIFSSVIRHGVLYIASIKDGLKKYAGGDLIESIGGGTTVPGSFRQILYMKEIDRLFGVSDDAIYGQITWCDLGQPEVWDGANVERLKLQDGERVEGAEVLFGKLIIFTTYRVWIYYVSGNEENWKLEEAPSAVGCVAPNTIKKFGSKIWYLGESPKHTIGVYEFNGSSSSLLTDDISPMLRRINKNKKRNACAEIHDDLYTLSFAFDAANTNNISIDLDLTSFKKDGTPAIYGPHLFGFYSSCVLDGAANDKEFLMGHESNGYLYQEGGTDFDGSLIQPRFLSMVHNDDDFNLMKQYKDLSIYFRPRSYSQARLRYYLSYGVYPIENDIVPSVQTGHVFGDYDVFEKILFGVPEMYIHRELLGVDARGTSIQIELINDVINHRLAFEGYDYEKQDLHTLKQAVSYAL